jgi:acyl-CoA thioester hydrolase
MTLKPNKKLTLDDFPFKHQINTRWRDLDAFNHVNNATFLSYIEDARTLFFKRWETNFKEKSLIVASVKIDYINQVKHPSTLILGQKVSRVGIKSFDVQTAIFCKKSNKLTCISTVTSVCYNFILNKSIPVFSEVKEDYNLTI